MFTLTGTPKVLSHPCEESLIQVELSPHSQFYATLSQSCIAIWTSFPSKRLIGTYVRDTHDLHRFGPYTGFTWDCEGLYIAASVCFVLFTVNSSCLVLFHRHYLDILISFHLYLSIAPKKSANTVSRLPIKRPHHRLSPGEGKSLS